MIRANATRSFTRIAAALARRAARMSEARKAAGQRDWRSAASLWPNFVKGNR